MKIETLTGTLSGIAISIAAVRYVQHLGLLPVGYQWNPCDSKDLLLLWGSVVLIVYKKIFFRAKNKRKEQ
jgi:hypothetical protein